MLFRSLVHECLKAANILKDENISARVVNIHTIKPLDEALILLCAKETGAILTVEEHSIYGGLGSAVAEACAKSYPVPMDMIGLTSYSESGDYFDLLAKHGLTGADIAAKAKKSLSKKNKY